MRGEWVYGCSHGAVVRSVKVVYVYENVALIFRTASDTSKCTENIASLPGLTASDKRWGGKATENVQ